MPQESLPSAAQAVGRLFQTTESNWNYFPQFFFGGKGISEFAVSVSPRIGKIRAKNIGS